VYVCSVASMVQGFTSAVDSYSVDSEMFLLWSVTLQNWDL